MTDEACRIQKYYDDIKRHHHEQKGRRWFKDLKQRQKCGTVVDYASS
jgi:hypothetical protein